MRNHILFYSGAIFGVFLSAMIHSYFKTFLSLERISYLFVVGILIFLLYIYLIIELNKQEVKK